MIDGATEELVKCLGVFSFDCSKFSTKTPVEWIKTALIGENAEVKKKNIENNIRFYLGRVKLRKALKMLLIESMREIIKIWDPRFLFPHSSYRAVN